MVFDILMLLGYNVHMETKDKIDLLSKKADVVYKKVIVLLAASGGSGSYAISGTGLANIALYLLFGFFVVGIMVNYFELNTIKKQLNYFCDYCSISHRYRLHSSKTTLENS